MPCSHIRYESPATACALLSFANGMMTFEVLVTNATPGTCLLTSGVRLVKALFGPLSQQQVTCYMSSYMLSMPASVPKLGCESHCELCMAESVTLVIVSVW